MKYSAILFDLDGTITNSFEGITKSVQYALSKLNFPVLEQEELRCFIGPPLKDSFEEFCQMDSSAAQKAVEFYRERFRDIGIYENALYDGIPKLLEQLHHAGQKLCIASSKPRVFVERILEYFQISRWFSVVTGSELNGRLGDKSDVIQETMKRANLLPDQTVMIGDRCFDAIGAMENKIDFIAAGYGFGSREEFDAYPLLFYANHPLEIGEFILKGQFDG